MIPLDKETFEAYMERLLEQVERVVGALNKNCLLYTSPSPRDTR